MVKSSVLELGVTPPNGGKEGLPMSPFVTATIWCELTPPQAAALR